ncbi:hypothetical protein GALL_347110 [mine drainage metagenome]|uniref:Uncharacterized protein n=1 Tax=mine drainage metagenome TaxID=410659 RepID=A0A1J5QIY2_9ZZZZ
MTGAVGEDERPACRREVPVGDVDRDALLTFGPQTVGEQREVGLLESAVAADALDGVELVGQDRL